MNTKRKPINSIFRSINIQGQYIGKAMKKTIQNLFVIIFIFQLNACATKPKSDADHYKEMRKSVVYKTYQKASIKVMKPVVKEYNKKLAKENKAKSGATHVHALLGLIWMVAAEPKYSLAESEYAVSKANKPGDRYAALVIQSLTMQNLSWYHLAKQKSAEANNLVKKHGLSNRYDNMLVMVHAVGSARALQEGNIPFVASEVRDLGVATNQDWLVELGDATQEVYAGASSKAIARLDKLKNDPELTAQERKGVAKVAEAVKAGGKNVSKEVAKAVVKVVLEEAIKTSPLTPIVVQKLPDKYQKKLAKYL